MEGEGEGTTMSSRSEAERVKKEWVWASNHLRSCGQFSLVQLLRGWEEGAEGRGGRGDERA